MRIYKINRNLESTPKVWGLRTPGYLAALLLIGVMGLVIIMVLKSLIWTLVILAVLGVSYHFLRLWSDDNNMNIRVNDQPERIEGFRETDI
ncbi:hypothetical protein [Ekhidna sp.]